ncbi:MAG: hypothetical protein V1647_02610 [Pseudomonadota bacterium]
MFSVLTILSVLLSLNVSLSAAVLPPGFVIRQFPHTRDKVTSMKIEENVSYGGTSFKETIWYKTPGKLRVVLDLVGDGVTFIRNGSECVLLSGGKRIKFDACPSVNTNFYYNLLTPYGNYIEYIKTLSINAMEGAVSIKKMDDGTYSKSEGVYLARLDKKPIYIIGITDGVYKSAASDGVDMIASNLKDKGPQVWLSGENFYPIRVFGSNGVEIKLGGYVSDGNEVPFPHSISFISGGETKVSYGVTAFETETDLNDELFDVKGAKKKSTAFLEDQNISEIKKKLIGYVKEFR